MVIFHSYVSSPEAKPSISGEPPAEAGKVQEHLDPSAELSRLVFLTPPTQHKLQDWE